MNKKTKGILKFFVLCGIVFAAAAAVIAVINKCRNKLPCCDDNADDCDSEGGCCDGGCDECELCDIDDDADEEVESVEAAPENKEAQSEADDK